MVGVSSPTGGHEHASHPMVEQQLDVLGLPCRIAVAVADEQREAVRSDDVLDTPGDVGEERVGGVEHHVGDRAAQPGPQLPS